MSYHVTSRPPMPSTRSKTTNILTFDGGGVRGLSSLIILKRLMKYVNDQEGLSPEGLTPKDLFSLVAGTSTGGLIALMLGRFGMPVDDCIAQYFTFSEEIFGHYSKRGKWSRGLLKDRYDGNRLKNSVRKLAGRKDTCDNQSVLMQDQQHENGIPCTVLAAEFEGNDLRYEPAYLCSHNCDGAFACRVCDAAQATTAAPGYFPFCCIGNRYFIDGGFGHNNPSYDIYTHYMGIQGKDVSPTVDMDKILIVNIGTGVDRRRVGQSEEPQRPQQPPTQVKRHRQSLTGMANMIRQMKAHTTNAQGPFYILKFISRVNEGMLDIHRFSADTGVHKIKLDKFRELKEIEKLTNEYINRPDVCKELVEVAKKLVHGWREQHSPETVLLSTGDNKFVPAPVSVSHFPNGHVVALPVMDQQAAAALPDAPTLPQDTTEIRAKPPTPSAQPVPPSTPETTAPHSLRQPPLQPSSHQPSPSTRPGSTIGPDMLGEDVIDLAALSNRVEPSDTTPLSIQERANEPLPDRLSPRSAHPTGSLNGTTPQGSPNRLTMREDGLHVDINNKELGMALGGQFGPQESLS